MVRVYVLNWSDWFLTDCKDVIGSTTSSNIVRLWTPYKWSELSTKVSYSRIWSCQFRIKISVITLQYPSPTRSDVMLLIHLDGFIRAFVYFSLCAESSAYTLCAFLSHWCSRTIFFPWFVRIILTKTDYMYFCFSLIRVMSSGVVVT